MAAIDDFADTAGHGLGLIPYTKAEAVTVSDTVDLVNVSRALYVGGTGDVKVNLLGGSTVTLKTMPVGLYPNIRITRVYSTGTTATNLVALR